MRRLPAHLYGMPRRQSGRPLSGKPTPPPLVPTSISPHDSPHYDAIVVGGGIVGFSTAHYLTLPVSEGGLGLARIAVVESAPDIAQGASWHNGGLFCPSLAMPWTAPALVAKVGKSLLSRSLAVTVDAPAMARTGSLDLFAAWLVGWTAVLAAVPLR